MNLPHLLQVTGKEVLSTVRDRRAMASNLLIPLLLLPGIMLGLPLVLGGLFEREQSTETELAVENLGEAPADLVSALKAANLVPVDSDDAKAAVRSGEAVLGLLVPPTPLEFSNASGTIELVSYSKQGNLRAEVAAAKLSSAIENYRKVLVANRLGDAGLDPALLEPVTIRAVDASSPSELGGGQLSWIIPFFIALYTLTGGQMAAIDATAGEKERGTLEALLVTPVRRADVVMGKWLATLLFGLSAAAMAIAGYIAGTGMLKRILTSSSNPAGEDVTALVGTLQVTPSAVVTLLVSALLLAGMLAALLLGVAMFARSFKEAQTYVAPLGFLLILPVAALQFKDLLDIGTALYLLPIVNALVLMDDVVSGTAEQAAILVTWSSLAILTALLLAFATRNFKDESVLFRT